MEILCEIRVEESKALMMCVMTILLAGHWSSADPFNGKPPNLDMTSFILAFCSLLRPVGATASPWPSPVCLTCRCRLVIPACSASFPPMFTGSRPLLSRSRLWVVLCFHHKKRLGGENYLAPTVSDVKEAEVSCSSLASPPTSPWQIHSKIPVSCLETINK